MHLQSLWKDTLLMKTLVRALILLLVSLWLGGVLFFPVVAWAAFSTLPDTHTAGTVARLCLHTLHLEGLGAGSLLLLLLLIAGAMSAERRQTVAPVCATLAMLALTAFSQYSVMPRMEVDRLAVGGSIDAASPADPHRIDFNRLHTVSVRLETGVLAAGLLLVLLLAREPRPASPLIDRADSRNRPRNRPQDTPGNTPAGEQPLVPSL